MNNRFMKAVAAAILTVAWMARASADERVIDADMNARTRLPFQGIDVKQVSGIALAVGSDGSITTPGQVCTLIFEKDDQRAVVRVWENKDHRYFVSTRGDDGNPGAEERPFRTLAHAMETVADQDPDGDVYAAGGDYVEDRTVVMRFKVSLYGGFDENGWQRDPVIQQSVLLPHGFRENWVDDMCDRFKDLRRANHRYHETRIWHRRFTKESIYTLTVGAHRGFGKVGSPDTFCDGITVFGCPHTGVYEPMAFAARGRSVRTIRNCVAVQFWDNGHAFMPGGSGAGLYENNIFWGGIVGHQGHARPQTVFREGARYRLNLQVGATGGDYNRMLLCWGPVAGVYEENQMHGGNSFGWSAAMQLAHAAMTADGPYIFRGNTVLTDYITHPAAGLGLVVEENEFYLVRGGFDRALLMSQELVIRNNVFHVTPTARTKLYPVAEKMTHRLGGTWGPAGREGWQELIQPDGKARTPTIENNRVAETPDPTRRPRNYVDIERLSELVRTRGEEAAIRPQDPPKNLRAWMVGSAKVALQWEPSRDRDVVGYRVYYGPCSNSYANTQVVTGATAIEIENLKHGTWHFSVAAHKEAFVECWTLSNEVDVTLPR
ncbi:MAG: fibronectin type III domain-containing protein [Planctomycetota bacterium]|jgi:hypothetical protein